MKELTVQTDGGLSFSIREVDGHPWLWYLDLKGTPLYLIGNACGTCEAIFRRVHDLQAPIAPEELTQRLAEGLLNISDDIVETVRLLLPKGEYRVSLLTLLPTLVSGAQRPQGVDCQADYFWWRLLEQKQHEIYYELTLPFVRETDLHPPRIAWYRERIQQGYKPTALALSIVDLRAVNNRYTEWALVRFLLDGHHKVMAASQLGQPITILSFLRETGLTGVHNVDERTRAFYSSTELR